MLISIIIPAYNVEPYVLKCLESVCRQDIEKEDYEVIIINDGSTDGTSRLIEKFIEENANSPIKYISQLNKGLSATRNQGLDVAKGDYVWFVDSDDWIEPNCLGYIRKNIDKFKPELLILTTKVYKENERYDVIRNLQENKLIEGRTVFFKSWIYPYSGVQFYIYNRFWLRSKNISFYEGIYYEDLPFSSIVLNETSKCLYLKNPVYNYLIRNNSITTSNISIRHIDSLFIVTDIFISLVKDKPSPIFYDMLGKMIRMIYRMIRNLEDEELKQMINDKFHSLPFIFPYILKSHSIKNIIGWSFVHLKTLF